MRVVSDESYMVRIDGRAADREREVVGEGNHAFVW